MYVRLLAESLRRGTRRKLLAVSKSSPTAVPVYEVLKPWDR